MTGVQTCALPICVDGAFDDRFGHGGAAAGGGHAGEEERRQEESREHLRPFPDRKSVV